MRRGANRDPKTKRFTRPGGSDAPVEWPTVRALTEDLFHGFAKGGGIAALVRIGNKEPAKFLKGLVRIVDRAFRTKDEPSTGRNPRTGQFERAGGLSAAVSPGAIRQHAHDYLAALRELGGREYLVTIAQRHASEYAALLLAFIDLPAARAPRKTRSVAGLEKLMRPMKDFNNGDRIPTGAGDGRTNVAAPPAQNVLARPPAYTGGGGNGDRAGDSADPGGPGAPSGTADRPADPDGTADTEPDIIDFGGAPEAASYPCPAPPDFLAGRADGGGAGGRAAGGAGGEPVL